MCDNGHDLIFISIECEIINSKSGNLVAKDIKNDKNVYMFDETRHKCCMSKVEEPWYFHRRLGHVNF